MHLFKSRIKNIISRIIRRIRRTKSSKIVHMWAGNYSDWDSAKENCSGYEDHLILEKCKNAILKVKKGDAVYERDSVLFDKIEYSWPLIAVLLKAAIENNNHLNVVDFGGSLGSSYFQNKTMIPENVKISWNIVEQENFTETGNNEIKTEELNFYYSIEEATKNHKAHVLLLSSVIQYLHKPYDFLPIFTAHNFDYIIIDRTSFINDIDERLTIQNVPEEIYKANYPCWFFNESKFLNTFLNKYELIANFNSYADPCQVSEDGKQMYWKGYCFKLKN